MIADRASTLLKDVKFRDWDFQIDQSSLRVTFVAPDSVTGEHSRQYGRPWQLWEAMTDSAIVLTAWAAVEMAVTHEAREDFKYKKRRILGPHIDVEALLDVARQLDL